MVVGLLVIAGVAASLLLGHGGSTPKDDVRVAVPSTEPPEYSATDDLGLADQDVDRPATAPARPGTTFPGAGVPDLKGLRGEGGILGLPREKVVLTMTSAAPIAYVGYIVPTSLDHSTGTVTSPGTSWSLTTTAYGPPDYAQLFSLAGPAGVPVTCTITVNGRVTETRTTSGPHDQLFCQG
ncbi:hypothetical protein DX116_16985 [Aeromicrobium endophyticum]|uniref:MmpS family membrane protein n=1 Tax=Aeromicrobium endophyticum TaxID=2292704 RepID=A0A371P4C0_9ACTN|nr:hypothetical protein DX116_16985 [Aeromicrobium endophyticum]